MAEDKSFIELIKEVQKLNENMTQQKEELVDAQNRTTEMVTRRLTKAQTAQLDKDNEQNFKFIKRFFYRLYTKNVKYSFLLLQWSSLQFRQKH